MNITWHGQSFFEIRVKNKKKETINLVIDPFDESLGLEIPKIEAQILLSTHSHSDNLNIKAVKGEPFRIQEPGEYEVKEIFIKGISFFNQNTIYKIEAEEIKLCHLGDLAQKELTPEQLDEIGEVDILMIPVGGIHTIDGKTAASVCSQIEPRIIIPMHYKIPKLKMKIEGVEKFLKVMGAEDIQPEKKLKISLRDLPKEETEIVVLSP